MVKRNSTGQQPMPASPHAPGKPKEKPYGESAAKKTSDGGKTGYDVPAKAADDFAIDELREKRIRGNEATDDPGQTS